MNEICSQRNLKINDLLPKIDVKQYEEICEKNKNIDIIANTIKNDDIDTFQRLISSNIDAYLKRNVEKNIFDPSISSDMTYLNYAAAKGSIKCFKYLILNNQKIDNDTLGMAVIGGNNEIIRIMFNKCNYNHISIKFAIQKSIELHRYDIFDWIFEQKFETMEQKSTNTLLYTSASNGNIYALIQIIDRIDFIQTYENLIFDLIIAAAENGFYLLTLFLFGFINKKKFLIKDVNFHRIVTTINFSIFKLFEQLISENDFVESIQKSIKYGLMNIIEYISELFQKSNIKLNSNASIDILTNYLNNTFNENLVHFIETINKILFINVMGFCQILKNTYKSKNIKEYIKIADLIHDENENNDFTKISYKFIKYDLKEVVNYFIEKKFHINYEDLSEKIIEKGLVDSSLFPLLLDQVNSDYKKLLINYQKKFKPLFKEIYISKRQYKILCLKRFLSIQGIESNNYFDENLIKEDMLESFLNNFGKDIEKQKWQLEKITKILIDEDNNQLIKIELKAKVLEKIIKLNIINPNLRVINNTILTFACQNNLIEIVKSLLLYDSIDVNLNIPKTGDTPLITSIKRYNNEITKLLINNSKIKIDIKNYRNETALVYAAKLNQDEIVNLLLQKIKDHNYDLFLSNLKKNKQFIFNQFLSVKTYSYEKIIIDKPIIIKPKSNSKIDFIVDFPDILTKNLNESITSPTYCTGNNCAQFIIDFANNSFTYDIIDFRYTGSFLSSQITFLNQNSEKSKTIKFSFIYCESYKSHSQQLPFSIQEIFDQKNGWLFDNSLKCQIVQNSKTCFYSHLYPVSLHHQSKCRLIIPVSLFSQYEKEKIIYLNPIICENLSIKPFIIFGYNNDNRLIIQTNFKIYCQKKK